jgi:hypothetical protein
MSEDEKPIVICPHCKDYVLIDKINCAIFRHGIFKKNGKQINPHTSKDLCDKYIKNNLIYGCGKPFKIVIVDDIVDTEICDYI